ncbi:hypothetical protein FIBSPDRAFT_744777, partial [Athelia psychrophila]
ESEDPEVVLSDSLAFLGGKQAVEDPQLRYSPLLLAVAPEVILVQATTLFANHLFSPSWPPPSRRVLIELGAGCALPSWLMATLPCPPARIHAFTNAASHLLASLSEYLSRPLILGLQLDYSAEYDIVFLSDLLHFRSSHYILVKSLTALLSRVCTSRVYVTPRNNTRPDTRDNFISCVRGNTRGLIGKNRTY